MVNARHSQSAKAIAELAQKLDTHAGAVEMLRPTVAALELSRSKLACWATIGFGVIIVFGWIVEATIRWARVGLVAPALSGMGMAGRQQKCRRLGDPAQGEPAACE